MSDADVAAMALLVRGVSDAFNEARMRPMADDKENAGHPTNAAYDPRKEKLSAWREQRKMEAAHIERSKPKAFIPGGVAEVRKPTVGSDNSKRRPPIRSMLSRQSMYDSALFSRPDTAMSVRSVATEKHTKDSKKATPAQQPSTKHKPNPFVAPRSTTATSSTSEEMPSDAVCAVTQASELVSMDGVACTYASLLDAVGVEGACDADSSDASTQQKQGSQTESKESDGKGGKSDGTHGDKVESSPSPTSQQTVSASSGAAIANDGTVVCDVTNDDAIDEECTTHDVPTGASSGVLASSSGTSGAEKDGHFWRTVMEGEKVRLDVLCAKWDAVLQGDKSADIPEDVAGQIRATIGQAQLLVRKRFTQYGELCDHSVNKTGELETRATDLEGFWDVIKYQIDNVYSRFEHLAELEARNWSDVIAPRPSSAASKETKKKAAPKASTASVTNKTASAEAARQRLAAVKAAMKQRSAVSLPEGDSSVPAADIMRSPSAGANQMRTSPAFAKKSGKPLLPSSVAVLTPVRATRKERNELGSDVVLTPVRRSTRATPSRYRASGALDEMPMEALLEQTDYAFTPNKALAHTDIMTIKPSTMTRSTKKAAIASPTPAYTTPSPTRTTPTQKATPSSRPSVSRSPAVSTPSATKSRAQNSSPVCRNNTPTQSGSTMTQVGCPAAVAIPKEGVPAELAAAAALILGTDAPDVLQADAFGKYLCADISADANFADCDVNGHVDEAGVTDSIAVAPSPSVAKLTVTPSRGKLHFRIVRKEPTDSASGTPTRADVTAAAACAQKTISNTPSSVKKYAVYTPNKRVRELLGTDVVVSPVRRSGRLSIAHDTSATIASTDELPADLEYGYVPNPSLL